MTTPIKLVYVDENNMVKLTKEEFEAIISLISDAAFEEGCREGAERVSMARAISRIYPQNAPYDITCTEGEIN